MKSETLYTVLAVVVLTLLAIPVGGALVLGFVLGDSPCIMCWEQRIGMLIISLLGLFILRYGARPRYIGMAILVSSWGMFMAVRHTALHAARDIGQGFSIEIMGAHTYTWALVIYWICVATMGVLLLCCANAMSPRRARCGRCDRSNASPMIAFLVLVAANMVQAFASTGPPPFVGQSDPVRFSFNPKHWVWSLEEWHLSAYPVSLRGRFDVAKPDVAKANPDPAAGPFVDLPVLEVVERRPLGLPLRGTPTDLAYEPTSGRFALTTQLGIYILPAAMDRIERYTVVDPGFSVDLGTFAGTAFLDPHTIIAVGENKSYVVVRENDAADADANFRYFLESAGVFDDVTRGRFTTVRARTMFTMAAAFDAATQWVYTVALPHARSRHLVVSRFDRRDLTLSEEFVPAIDRGVRHSGARRGPQHRRPVHHGGDGAWREALRAERELRHPPDDRPGRAQRRGSADDPRPGAADGDGDHRPRYPHRVCRRHTGGGEVGRRGSRRGHVFHCSKTQDLTPAHEHRRPRFVGEGVRS